MIDAVPERGLGGLTGPSELVSPHRLELGQAGLQDVLGSSLKFTLRLLVATTRSQESAIADGPALNVLLLHRSCRRSLKKKKISRVVGLIIVSLLPRGLIPLANENESEVPTVGAFWLCFAWSSSFVTSVSSPHTSCLRLVTRMVQRNNTRSI